MKIHKHVSLIIIISALLFVRAYSQQYQPTNVAVTTSGAQSETAIAVDPNHPNHLMATWNDFTNSQAQYQPGYSFSTDGGNTWSAAQTFNFTGFDPSCAIDKAGREYYTYGTKFNGGDEITGPIKISYSITDGPPWSSYQISSLSTHQDKPYMTVDNTGGNNDGRVYISWTDLDIQNNTTKIKFRSAFIQDNVFSLSNEYTIATKSSITPIPFSYIAFKPDSTPTPTGSGPFVQGSIPVVAPNGDIFVAWLDVNGNGLNGAPGSIKIRRISRLTNGSYSFDPTITAANIPSVAIKNSIGALRATSIPTIAINPINNNIYIAYTQKSGSNLNIYYVCSTDAGQIWSPPAFATASTSSFQFFPWLSASPSGVISLTYYQGTSTSVDVYAAELYPGNNAFSTPNVRITHASSNPSANVHFGADYMGVTTIGTGNVFPLWTDISSSSHIQTTPYYYAGGTVSQSLTIPAGKTAVFAPGGTTKFTSNTSLTVTGTLSAIGTSANGITFTSTSGYWGGITFNSANGSSISNTTISYALSPVIINSTSSITISGCTLNHSSFYDNNSSAAAAIQINGSSPTINSTTIEGQSNSWNGVRFAAHSHGSLNGCTIENLGDGNGVIIQGGSNPTIYGNSILNNYYHGITTYYNGTANPSITDNSVTNNTRTNYVGIYFQSSIGVVRFNNVSGFIYGVWCRFTSSPNAGGLGQEGSNLITNNTYGLVASDNSYPDFGSGNPGRNQYWGVCNNIYGNSTYDALSVTGSGISANFNWWGQFPLNTSKFHSDDNSHIAYNYPEMSSGDCVLNQGYAPAAIQANNVNDSSPSNNSASSLMQQAMQSKSMGNYTNAAQVCRNMLNDKTVSAFHIKALTTLYNVFQLSKDSAIVNDLIKYSSLKNNLGITAKELLASAYEGLVKLSDAEAIAKGLISSYPNTDAELQGLFILTSLSAYDTAYNATSSAALNELVQKYSSSIDDGTITLLGGTTNGNLPKTFNQAAEQNLNINNPDSLKYELGNYPNPFNPTTTISYQIPKNGFVSLKIYDVLGKEVANLVNENKSTGRYNVNFNASNLASGVYLYQLKVNDFVSTKKLVLLK